MYFTFKKELTHSLTKALTDILNILAPGPVCILQAHKFLVAINTISCCW